MQTYNNYNEIPKDIIAGVEVKHITYLKEKVPEGKYPKHDVLVEKLLVHTTTGEKHPVIRFTEDYKRPYWVTHKGRRNHKEKKDYELVSNLQKYMSTDLELARNAARSLQDYSMGPNPRLRQLARSPYLYGTDVSAVSCRKYDYQSRWPDLITRNTSAGGDIETNVLTKDNEIICMSVSHKKKARLVYLKSWVSDIKDPVTETLEMAKKTIGDLIVARDLDIEVLIAETPAQVVLRCIEVLHRWKPDFFGFWNIDYDMPKILKTLEAEGIDPAQVFSDPSVPQRYKYFDYKKGTTQKTTASGKVISKNFEDQWHWVTHPASFQCIDQMLVYRNTRLAKGKDASLALDAILKKELRSFSYKFTISKDAPGDIVIFNELYQSLRQINRGEQPLYDKKFLKEKFDIKPYEKGACCYVRKNGEWIEDIDNVDPQLGDVIEIQMNFGKFKFLKAEKYVGLRWHQVMQKDHKIIYGIYNIVDSIRLEQLDEKISDLASSISLFSKTSDYKTFNSTPKRLCDDMHFWYLRQAEPKVIGSSSDQMVMDIDRHVMSHDGWVVTLPSSQMAPIGMKLAKDMPNYRSLCFSHIADLDIVSTYPTVSQILKIERATCAMEFSTIKGKSMHTRREVGVNLTGGRVNSVEICQKIMNAPKLDDLLAGFIASKQGSPSLGNGLVA